MKPKGGLLSFVWHKKYKYRDFVEPLFALPFAYALLRILEGTINTLTFVLIFVLVLIYLPAIIVFVESPRR